MVVSVHEGTWQVWVQPSTVLVAVSRLRPSYWVMKSLWVLLPSRPIGVLSPLRCPFLPERIDTGSEPRLSSDPLIGALSPFPDVTTSEWYTIRHPLHRITREDVTSRVMGHSSSTMVEVKGTL